MKKSIIYKLMLAGTLFGGAGLTSCVDDGLTDHSSDLESIYQVEKDEHVLGLVLSLNQLQGGGTRSQLGDLADLASGSGQGLKDIEEYVNTDNLYILFFNLDGTYLFQIDKPVAVPIGQSENGNDCQWFVRIPVKEINPNLIKYIEENPFKIAVLANWSFDSDLNLGGNLSGWEEFKFNEPLDSEGNLKYYEPAKDGQYWLTVTLGPDENYSYYSRRKYWIWDYDKNLTAEKQEELFMEVFQSYKSVWKYDSLRANTDSINTIYPSAPDSLIYCRQYYEDGKLAAEGWMLHDWNREGDYTDNIGTWKYYTRDGIMIEKQWPLKQWPLE